MEANVISNPSSVFVAGGETEEFMYEGGTTLYHFCPNDNGLSQNMTFNIIFLADSLSHAGNILRRLLLWYIDTTEESRVYKVQAGDRWTEVWETQALEKIATYETWLAALDANLIKLEPAPTNQVYKVGWASNDTL